MKLNISHFAIISYTPEAIERNVRGEANLRIYHIINGQLAKEEDFTWGTYERLMKRIPVVFEHFPHRYPHEDYPIRSIINLF